MDIEHPKNFISFKSVDFDLTSALKFAFFLMLNFRFQPSEIYALGSTKVSLWPTGMCSNHT